ncbi:P2RX3 protein, partial [Eulacestoma nigropectus]|nr:P2RX3 protein [Eulacestoma nigropectus]
RWVSDFFSYETTKSVVVKSWVVGVVNRGVQLLILAYFVGRRDNPRAPLGHPAPGHPPGHTPEGSSRHRGSAVTPTRCCGWHPGVTRVIRTENQEQGLCPEREAAFHCSADRDCRELSPGTSNGMLTGRCIPYNETLHTCEIQGWCPPEVDTVDVPVMLEAENFTLLIKNSIRFPLFGFEKTNLPAPGSGVELGRCRFHPQ